MNVINIFTDGSSTFFTDESNNRCAYGGIGVYCMENNKFNICKSYCDSTVTNQRMELLACIKGIQKCIRLNKNKKNYNWKLNIYTDSMYTIKCATVWSEKWILCGWKRQVGKQLKDICNLDLIKKLYTLTKLYPINYYHVKSHQKEPDKDSEEWLKWKGNMEADGLAKKVSRLLM